MTKTGAARTVVIRSVLAGLLGSTGWGAYSTYISTQDAEAVQDLRAELGQVQAEVDQLQQELGAAVEERNGLKQSVGALSEARAKLRSVEDELKALEFSREQWHAQIASAQQELAGLRKQVEPQETGTFMPLARPGRQAGALSPSMR